MSTIKSFQLTPGRDVTKDRPADFDIAEMYYSCRSDIAADATVLDQMRAAIDRPTDLISTQWAQWYSVAR